MPLNNFGHHENVTLTSRKTISTPTKGDLLKKRQQGFSLVSEKVPAPGPTGYHCWSGGREGAGAQRGPMAHMAPRPLARPQVDRQGAGASAAQLRVAVGEARAGNMTRSSSGPRCMERTRKMGTG